MLGASNQAERLVVVFGVVPKRWVGCWVSAGHDAPGAAMFHTWGQDCVFAVVAAAFLGQPAFPVAKGAAIFACEFKRAACANESCDPCGFWRQGVDVADGILFALGLLRLTS